MIWSRSFRLRQGVVVHGGAGLVLPERRAEHQAGCVEAAALGHEMILRGDSSLDVVQAVARRLEDLPQFNAGTGAALNQRGEVEHDAALMCGRTLAVGGVAALRSFRNPIDVARAVLDDARHVLLCGEGAAAFAIEKGFVACEPSSLVTEAARSALMRTQLGMAPKGWAGGTIGAVARDRDGHLAAATSTGGIVNKLPGRIGDSPIIGAGTLADDEVAAISATGDGEGIMRLSLVAGIAAMLRRGVEAEAALCEALELLSRRAAATGGVILIGHEGEVALARSTATMSWALCSEAGKESGV